MEIGHSGQPGVIEFGAELFIGFGVGFFQRIGDAGEERPGHHRAGGTHPNSSAGGRHVPSPGCRLMVGKSGRYYAVGLRG